MGKYEADLLRAQFIYDSCDFLVFFDHQVRFVDVYECRLLEMIW